MLYRCEEDVAVGMAGTVPIEKNGHISVEVRLADVQGTSLSFRPNVGEAISVAITGALDSPPPF